MKLQFLLCLVLLDTLAFSQSISIPEHLVRDEKLCQQLSRIATDLELDGDFDVGEDGIEQISLAVIDLGGPEPRFGGVNYDNFIYPASVYKIYVAAEVLRQVYCAEHDLFEPVVVCFPNAVDHNREISTDPRPLLQEGDTVTVNYLLDLMITRSDNSAANCLIDLAGRENINRLLHEYGWQGSEVTRKFLKRKFEDPGYEDIRGTETCALHAADFMYRIQARTLVNPWTSMQMETLLGRQLDKSKLAAGLPREAMFYHKTGWFAFWTHDVGIVDSGDDRYVIACFLPLPEDEALTKYARLAEEIHALLKHKDVHSRDRLREER